MKLSFSVKKFVASAVSTYLCLATKAVIALANAPAAGADELGIGKHVDNFNGVLQGPILKIAAIILVLVGVFLFTRGEELHQSFKTITPIVFGFALLCALPTILTAVGVSGSILPMVLVAH